MPRVSREQADKNRLTIEEAASRLFREHGFKGVSVADLTSAAGLTHGGFYGHFESKEELAVIASDKAFGQTTERWARRIGAHPGDSYAAVGDIIHAYLDRRSRDNPGSGCPAVAFATDVAREPAASPVRASYIAGVKAMVEQIGTLADDAGSEAAQAHARMQVAAMVGALTLARATEGDPISEQFLTAVRDFLHPGA